LTITPPAITAMMATTSMISINVYPPALDLKTGGFFITQKD
jgi:hypothetical protein